MPTFHRGEADAARFWSIEPADGRLRITHGRVGGKAREQFVAYDNDAEALAAMVRRIRDKRREGYAEQPYTSPMHRALEEAVVAAPDDLAAHMAFADWLSEQADGSLRARGELIQVQLALEQPGRGPDARRALVAREAELIARHAPLWLGDLAELALDAKANRVRFARGWVGELTVGRLTVELARRLNAARELRLLRRLVIHTAFVESGATDYDFDPDEQLIDPRSDCPALSVLRGADHFGNVEAFHLGDLDGDRGFVTYPDADALPEVMDRMPRLRELGVNARELMEDDLFAWRGARRLRVLRLERLALDDDGVGLLVQSKLLKNLKELQMWHARISDDGARRLARCKDLKNLERLDVSFNYLTEAGLAALRKTGVPLLAEYQMRPEDDFEEDDPDDEFDDELDEDWE